MDREDDWPDSHILESKVELICSMENLAIYIDNLMEERRWKKICSFKIDSDKYKKCTSVSTKYATYSKLIQLIYQIPDNKQGFVQVKLEGKDGDNIYSSIYINKYRLNMEVVFYFKQKCLIDRTLTEPKYWNFMGGYNMEVVRELYKPKVNIGFSIKSLDKKVRI